MSANPNPINLSEHDFEAIEDAVMETARGRWFLREYARRMRTAETGRLLDALSRIEGVLTGQSSIIEAHTQADAHLAAVEERRDRIATMASSLREQGYDGGLCAKIEREAQALAALARDMRGLAPEVTIDPPAEDILPPERPVLTDGESVEALDAGAPVTIEASVVYEAAPAPVPADLSGLHAVDALAFPDKLALFA